MTQELISCVLKCSVLDATISPAAKAVLIDTLHVSEEWPSPVTKVPSPPKFNGVHSVEMVEIAGSFHVQESEDALEVLIPFKVKNQTTHIDYIRRFWS